MDADNTLPAIVERREMALPADLIEAARDYARAPRGQRAYATKPVNRGCRVTILGRWDSMAGAPR